MQFWFFFPPFILMNECVFNIFLNKKHKIIGNFHVPRYCDVIATLLFQKCYLLATACSSVWCVIYMWLKSTIQFLTLILQTCWIKYCTVSNQLSVNAGLRNIKYEPHLWNVRCCVSWCNYFTGKKISKARRLVNMKCDVMYTVGLRVHHVRERGRSERTLNNLSWGRVVLKRTIGVVLKKTVGYLSWGCVILKKGLLV